MTVTPWTVKGDIDYEKLISKFGTEAIDKPLLGRMERHSGALHMHLRRGIFYSHRDLGLVLDEYEKGKTFVLYTGRGPSGPVHLGHLVPWLFTKHLQDVFGAKLFFQFTDDERLLIREKFSRKDTDHWVYENALDVLALGFEDVEFIVNMRHVAKIYTIALKIADKITISTARSIFGFTDDTRAGLYFFPAMQAAPCFLAAERSGEKIPCLVPAGIDQDTYWRMTRDVAEKLGYMKPAQIHGRILPGLQGAAKMSSSIPETAIYTTDSPETVRKKILNAYTGKNDLQTKGKPEVCSVYAYNFFLFEADDEEIARLEEDCTTGQIDCVECKRKLTSAINTFLADFQEKRLKAKDRVKQYLR